MHGSKVSRLIIAAPKFAVGASLIAAYPYDKLKKGRATAFGQAGSESRTANWAARACCAR